MAKTLTPRENMIRICRHETPEYLCDFTLHATGNNPVEVLERAPATVRPDGSLQEETGVDWFGVHWEKAGNGSTVDTRYPPVLTDIERWREEVHFPDLSKLDWEGIGERYNAGCEPDKMKQIIVHNGLFERLGDLMGMEPALVSLLTEPEKCMEFFDAMADYKIDLIDHYIRYCGAEFFEVHDDWGHQRNSFFSPELLSEVIAPATKRIVDFCKSKKVFYFHHSCGYVENLMDVMVNEIGIEGWTSCQAINNIPAILEKYQGKLVVRGGMDTPELMALESDPVHAKERLREMIRDYTRYDNLILRFRPATPVLRRMCAEIVNETDGILT